MKLWFIVFTIAAMLDFVWAIYTRHIVARNAGLAAFWAMIVAALIGVNTISYTENNWLLVPAAAGAFVGTYLATRR